MNNPSALHY